MAVLPKGERVGRFDDTHDIIADEPYSVSPPIPPPLFSFVSHCGRYYKLKEVIHGDAPGDIPISNVIMASCAAGVTSSVGVTPFDVIKTNLQARPLGLPWGEG